METPPHAWGRLRAAVLPPVEGGNTPTCVGKTAACTARRGRIWKHPHMRGEDPIGCSRHRDMKETPPHAWGRPSRRNHANGKERKHPHMRGEDFMMNSSLRKTKETPPHAWGRHHLRPALFPFGGNTPTCVGKTPEQGGVLNRGWKHPHMRGEDPIPVAMPQGFLGNTPTCVGKTQSWGGERCWMKKHPHMRGEDVCGEPLRKSWVETPPHAWGRRQVHGGKRVRRGNTPTCVGKTLNDH